MFCLFPLEYEYLARSQSVSLERDDGEILQPQPWSVAISDTRKAVVPSMYKA